MNDNFDQHFELPYTIGFCIIQDTVLMLHRKFPPNQNLWNGLGGKIDADETPDDAIVREIMEEAHLNINDADSVTYVGIVTWAGIRNPNNNYKGMYSYIINFNKPTDWKSKPTDEGFLEWKPLDWVIDEDNPQVADNIPYFLPLMLNTSTPAQYHCTYKDHNFMNLSVYPLSPQK